MPKKIYTAYEFLNSIKVQEADALPTWTTNDKRRLLKVGNIYYLGGETRWIAIADQKTVSDHIDRKDNPHGLTQVQIGYTAADVLAKLKTVDGEECGLDADLLDGKHASEFVLSGEAFNGFVTLKSTRNSEGTWSISSLTAGKPLIINYTSANAEPTDVRFRMASGTADGLNGGGDEWYEMGHGDNSEAAMNGFTVVVIPTSTVVSMTISRFSNSSGGAGGTLRAYQ